MAKTLPAITVTDAQYARLAAVIPGTTAAEKSAAYITLVKGHAAPPRRGRRNPQV